MVWEEEDTLGNGDIFFAFSTDNGQTFSTPDNLSKTPGRSDEPQISSEGNNVYVVWTESTLGSDIFYTTNNEDFWVIWKCFKPQSQSRIRIFPKSTNQ